MARFGAPQRLSGGLGTGWSWRTSLRWLLVVSVRPPWGWRCH